MQDPFVGTWRLDTGKSKFDANHRPAGGTMVFEREGEGQYLMTADGVKENGERVQERPARFICDGQTHPIPGMPGLTALATRPDPHTLRGEARREDGSVVGGGTFVVSADGRTLTATNFGWDSQLRQFEQKTVWDRVD